MPAVRGQALAIAGRVLRAAVLVALVVATAQGTLVTRLHFADIRLPVLGLALLASSPGWVLLGLAARGRGAPWAWLAYALAWGAFVGAWLVLFLGTLVEPLGAEIARAVEFLGPTVAAAAPASILAPIIEEPAKLLGAWIVVAAARRAGAVASVALGAAIGGLVGIGFGVAEAAHHMGELVGELGHIDLSGEFVAPWTVIWQVIEANLVTDYALLGLTNHALFTALAGAGLALLIQRRRRAAIACFGVALVAHALTNSVGIEVGQAVVSLLAGGSFPGPGPLPTALIVWLAAVASFLVAQGWAALLLVRVIRRGGKAGEPVRQVGGESVPEGS